MPFVPYVPSPLSPRAQELARRLTKTIDDFRREHPETSHVEIRRATRSAAIEAGRGTRPAAILVVAVIAVALVGLLLFSQESGAPPRTVWPLIAIAIGIAAAGLAVRLRNR